MIDPRDACQTAATHLQLALLNARNSSDEMGAMDDLLVGIMKAIVELTKPFARDDEHVAQLDRDLALGVARLDQINAAMRANDVGTMLRIVHETEAWAKGRMGP